MLGYRYWQSQFGSDPNVVNDTIIINGQSLTIVGVTPRGFDGTTLGVQPQVYVPITLRGTMNPGFDGTRRTHRSSTTSRRRCRRA